MTNYYLIDCIGVPKGIRTPVTAVKGRPLSPQTICTLVNRSLASGSSQYLDQRIAYPSAYPPSDCVQRVLELASSDPCILGAGRPKWGKYRKHCQPIASLLRPLPVRQGVLSLLPYFEDCGNAQKGVNKASIGFSVRCRCRVPAAIPRRRCGRSFRQARPGSILCASEWSGFVAPRCLPGSSPECCRG
jgi:hypothetical protein